MDLRRQLFEEVPEGYARWKAAREKFVDDLDAMVAAGSLPDALRQARRALDFLEPDGTDRALWERADTVLKRLVMRDDGSAQPLQVRSSTTSELICFVHASWWCLCCSSHSLSHVSDNVDCDKLQLLAYISE